VEETEYGKLVIQCDDGSVSAILRELYGCRVLTIAAGSNGRLMLRVLTRSTQQNLTKQTTWPNSPILMRLQSYTISIRDTKLISYMYEPIVFSLMYTLDCANGLYRRILACF
jgi:hypothetical protein